MTKINKNRDNTWLPGYLKKLGVKNVNEALKKKIEELQEQKKVAEFEKNDTGRRF